MSKESSMTMITKPKVQPMVRTILIQKDFEHGTSGLAKHEH
jgi:hypothetical protein